MSGSRQAAATASGRSAADRSPAASATVGGEANIASGDTAGIAPGRRTHNAPPRAVRRARIASRLAAAHHEVALTEIAAPTRRSVMAARARQTAMYLTHTYFAIPLVSVARAFGRDRSTVAHACRVIEDLRDDAGFDAAVARLELAAGVMLEWEENEAL